MEGVFLRRLPGTHDSDQASPVTGGQSSALELGLKLSRGALVQQGLGPRAEQRNE